VAALVVIGGDVGAASLVGSLELKGTAVLAFDSGDGQCRAKVFNDDKTTRSIVFGNVAQCKAMAEFRKVQVEGQKECRVCEEELNAENTAPASDAIPAYCNDENCDQMRDMSCTKILPCGHTCNGVKDEEECLPCLRPECAQKLSLRGDSDSLCSICYTYNLGAQPSIKLGCKHIYHYDCVAQLLRGRWNGAAIGFGFMGCPLCKVEMRHPATVDRGATQAAGPAEE
jgi:hypothetical protein